MTGLRRQESFARVDTPIHVILARDEEFGLGAGGEDTRDRAIVVEGRNESVRREREEGDSAAGGVGDAKWMQPPPPAYGLWRGSRVRPLPFFSSSSFSL